MKQDIINRLVDYIKSANITFSEDEFQMIRDAINTVIEASPTTTAGTCSRQERLTAASTDLAWIVLSLKRTRLRVDNSLKQIKDPQFVMLVRQGRPSTSAIEAEIRHTNDKVLALENNLQELDNLLEYMSNLEKNIDRKIWEMRDKASFAK